MLTRRLLVAAALAGAMLAACGSGGSAPTVVGSFYPLAWSAQEIGGSRISVVDLTPPGVEAHDTNLNARQVGQIESAKVVLLLGYLGFQPQVESAARDAGGDVVLLTTGLDLRPTEERGLSADPHVWLDPVLMRTMVERIGAALERAVPGDRARLEDRTHLVMSELSSLDHDYRSGLSSCRYTAFVATHEAFAYLADRYALRQIGIEGITPEAEPSASQLGAAEDAIRSGAAAPAVFYEGTADGERIGRSVAGDLGVPALPLGTLEFEPTSGDYISVMRANLASLRKGLQCR